jgi:4'-phosphopantetheinyl transferase
MASDSKVLGFSTGWAESAVSIAYSYGRKSQIVNIGIDIMQLTLPRDVSAGKHVEALAHKVRSNTLPKKPQ